MNDQTTIDQTSAEMSPPENTADMRRQARELIEVSNRGATPANRAQQIDFATDMAKSRFFIPEFLQGNVGDCLALMEIAHRADLSPYLLARQCYIDPGSKQVALMAQAFHALVLPWVVGDLDVAYEGEGDDRVCIVSGVLKRDPKKVRSHRSPKLADVRPRRNNENKIKGSPLWDRKPDVQLFYDTSRDWVRIYCPSATMGLYTGDELRDYGSDFARDVTPAGPPLRERLGPRTRTEGPQGEAHVVQSLNGKVEGVGAPASESAPAAAPVATEASAPETEKKPRKPRKKSETEPVGSEASPKENALRPEVGSEAPPSQEVIPPEPKPELPKSPEQWKTYCLGWIADPATKDYLELRARWKNEIKLRNDCGVVEEWRKPVMDALVLRCRELGEGTDGANAAK